MKEITKTSSLIPFLNHKNKVDLKYNKESMIERKEVFVNKVESVNEGDLTATCIISTQNPDRMGDVVISSGIKTDEFKQIPSIYVNHNYATMPVAKCLEIIHKDGMVEAKIQFVKEDELSMKIFNLVKNGVMRGISIGFDAEEVILRGTKTFDEVCNSIGMDMNSYQKTQRIINKWNLYEFSVVSIPANAECMVKSVKSIKAEDKPEEVVVSDSPKENEPEIDPNVAEEMKDHVKLTAYLKECGLSDEQIEGAFKTIVEGELDKDPNFYKEIEEEEEEEEPVTAPIAEEKAKEVVVSDSPKENALEKSVIKIIPQVKRHIQVIKTPDDDAEYIKKCVEARLSGKTRVVIV